MESNIDHYISLFTENPWYQAAAVLLAGLVIAKLINLILNQVVLRLTQRTASDMDDKIVAALKPALFYSIQLVALAFALDLALHDLGHWPGLILETSAVGLWMVFFVRLVKIVLRTYSHEQRSPIINSQTLPLFENIGIMLVLGAAFYAVFTVWKIDMTAWLASAGIVGIAVGFAAKDTLANLFSGVFIIADAPYKIGDYIVLDSGERGEVTHIGIRSTRMLNADDVEITIPNAIIGNTKVINESGGPHTKVRIRVSVGVAYGSDIDQVRKLLLDVATSNPHVCKTPEPVVRFTQFGASSLDHDLYCWVEDPSQRGGVLDELNCAVYKKLRAANVEIPYAKQDVYIKEMPANKT
jgi:small-conductance mechanosensitive channel